MAHLKHEVVLHVEYHKYTHWESITNTSFETIMKHLNAIHSCTLGGLTACGILCCHWKIGPEKCS